MLAIVIVVIGIGVALVAAGKFGIGPVVITQEGKQNIIFRFDRAVRVASPGISLRLPWPFGNQEVHEARWLYLNTDPDTVQTIDGENIIVDNYAIWRISDPVEFRRSFPGVTRESDAESRIDRAVRDDVREVIGKHTLTEILKDKRKEIMLQITSNTRNKMADRGIEVIDVRINRTDLPGETLEAVYKRMETERERLARKNRAEGEEEARRIRAIASRDARVVVAEARRDAEIAMGEGDARATAIYAEAYNMNPEFYGFLRSLQAYEKTIGAKTTLVISPKSEFFRLFESSGVDTLGEGEN